MTARAATVRLRRSATFVRAAAILLLAAATSPAFAAPAPVDQASWAGRKQTIRLRNGIDLAYVELGTPTGRPVVLLHGYTDTSRLWSIVAPYLAGHRLIIPDQRGHGASSKPECCYAPADFAFDLKLLLDALRISRAALVGSSMGSMVAQSFAAEYPERTTAIALAGSTALAPLDRSQPLWSTLTSRDSPANRNRAFLDGWSPAASPTPVDPGFVRHFDAEMAAVPAYVWRGVIRELTAFPVARHAADVKAPVLILSGGKDPLFGPEHHAALRNAYPRAEAHLLAALGHNLVVEQPHRVGPLLDDFLSRNGASTAP